MTTNTSVIGRVALRNTVWLTLISYAGQLISFVATIALTRMLGPQVFGWFSLAMFWSSVFGLRSKSGLSQAALRQPEMDGELLGTTYRLDLLLAAGSIALAVIGAAVLLQTGTAAPVTLALIVIALGGNLTTLVTPFGLALERELQLSRLSLVSLVSVVIAYGAAILLAQFGAGIYSLLAMNVITAVIAIIGVYLVCKWRLPWVFTIARRFSPAMARRLLAQGLPAGLSNEAILTIVNQFDNYLIGTFVGATTLGFYDRAFRTSQWSNILLAAALMRVGFLTFAKVQNDLPRLTHAVRLCIWVLTTLGIPIVLAVFFAAPELVETLYTAAWLPSAFFLRFLVVYSLISPFISLGSSLAYARGDIRTAVVIPVAQAATLVVMGFLLTLWQGALGTVVAVGIANAVGFILSARYIFRRLPLSPRVEFGPPLVAVAIATVTLLLLFRLPGWNELALLARLIAAGAAAAGVYSLSLFALRPGVTIERVRYLVQTFRGERLTA